MIVTRKHRGFYLRILIHDNPGKVPYVEASFEKIGKNDPVTVDEVVALYAPAMQAQAAIAAVQRFLAEKSSSVG